MSFTKPIIGKFKTCFQDIDRYVYGVKRYISTSDVSDSQVDISHYEGIKGWVTATQRAHGSTTVKPGNAPARIEMGFYDAKYAANPLFTIRGERKRQVNIGDVGNWPTTFADPGTNEYQVFAMDGREPMPSDYASRLENLQPTTESVQSTPFTMVIFTSIFLELLNCKISHITLILSVSFVLDRRSLNRSQSNLLK